MCGIIGIIGRSDVAPLLIDGLRRLEYRGYDSAGIATLVDGRIDRRRAEGKISNLETLVGSNPIGGTIGIILARRVQMTQMPELVAVLHSLVGLAAVAVGFASFMDPTKHFVGIDLTIHDIETYLGILIGAVTFSGSVIAFGKLSGRIGGKPLTLPGRHLFNLGLLIAAIWFGYGFVSESAAGGGLVPLLIMTAIALVFGIHMVMAIGGADMPSSSRC